MDGRTRTASLCISLACLLIYLSGIYCASFPHGSDTPIEDGSINDYKWIVNLTKQQTKPDFKMNQANFTVMSFHADVSLYARNDQCEGCPLQWKTSVTTNQSKSVALNSDFGSKLEIRKFIDADHWHVLCRDHKWLREEGDYWLLVWDIPSPRCVLVLANTPPNTKMPILVAFLILVGLAIIWLVLKQLYSKGAFQGVMAWKQRSKTLDHDFTSSKASLELNGSHSTVATVSQYNNEQELEKQQPPTEPQRSKRLKSLDAFRGLSIVVMIFVNYGGGRYHFFEHPYWNGLTVADLVFPWFIFIMGTAMAFSTRSLLKKESKLKALWKIVWRSIKLFGLGIFLHSQWGNDLSILRVPGVLQRFALTYLVSGTIHLLFAKKTDANEDKKWNFIRDLVNYWAEWLVNLALLALWLGITFGLPVPGCPRGYLGPGGDHGVGDFRNCSGGAAGYIDRLLLTGTHIYNWPTFKALYNAWQAYDPEGILGTITSVFMCFLGLQAGKILLVYKGHGSRVKRWLLWAVVTGATGALLCHGKQNGGWIPVNKNLWSLSFVLVASCFAYVTLALMYCVIDVKPIWSGAPLIYPGMNAIILYCGHNVFGEYFPVRWKVDQVHWQQLGMAMWGTGFWIVVAYVMYRKKTFITL